MSEQFKTSFRPMVARYAHGGAGAESMSTQNAARAHRNRRTPGSCGDRNEQSGNAQAGPWYSWAVCRAEVKRRGPVSPSAGCVSVLDSFCRWP